MLTTFEISGNSPLSYTELFEAVWVHFISSPYSLIKSDGNQMLTKKAISHHAHVTKQ